MKSIVSAFSIIVDLFLTIARSWYNVLNFWKAIPVSLYILSRVTVFNASSIIPSVRESL